jgi:hypothetical protein
MNLFWRCIDCNRTGYMAIVGDGPLRLADIFDSIVNQHTGAVMEKERRLVYVAGIGPASALDSAIVIYFRPPGDASLKISGATVVLELNAAGSVWDRELFEVRHVR